MSSHVTTWVLEMVDKVSSPFKSVNRWANNSYHSVTKLNRSLATLEKRSDKLSGRLKKIAIGVGAFALLSQSSLEFRNSMARSNTMMSVSQSSLDRYSNQVKDLAVYSGKAKKELADGLYNTISSGVPKDNAISFLKDSTKAAVGGTAELGVVVDTTAGFIKNYNESWENAAKIQDKFQKTVQLGQINGLGELASALPKVTNMAAQLGVSQSEMLGVFATGSGVLGKSAEVSTMLGATLNAMIKPSSEASKMAKKLGIAFDSQVIKKAGGLKNYIDVLLPRIKKYSEQTGISQEQVIGSLFGSTEAIKLVMAMGGTLNESWAKNTESIKNSAGSVQAAFDTMSGDTKMKLAQAKESFTNNIDSIVTALKPLTDFLISGFLAITKWASAFMNAHPALTRFIVITGALIVGIITMATVASLVAVKVRMMGVMLQLAAIRGSGLTKVLARAALGTLSLGRNMLQATIRAAGMATGYLLLAAHGIGSFIVSMVSATAAQWGLNIAMNANPIGLIVIGLMAIVGAVILVIKYWDTIKAKIVQFGKFFLKHHPFKWLINLADYVFPGFKQKVQDVFSSVIKWFKVMWDSIKGVWNKITAFFGFGDTKAEVTVVNGKEDKSKTKIKDLEKELSSEEILALLTNKETNKNLETTGGTSTSSGKTVTMNLEITNNFKMNPGNWRDEIEEIADYVVGRVNDGLRDGLIISQ